MRLNVHRYRDFLLVLASSFGLFYYGWLLMPFVIRNLSAGVPCYQLLRTDNVAIFLILFIPFANWTANRSSLAKFYRQVTRSYTVVVFGYVGFLVLGFTFLMLATQLRS
jgi:hypothetical protein